LGQALLRLVYLIVGIVWLMVIFPAFSMGWLLITTLLRFGPA
jgi:F0F1-type ATP synthase assembly protein I